MTLREGGIGKLNLVRCLADDLEIADNGVLNERILLERRLVEVMNIAFDARDSTKDMLDIGLDPTFVSPGAISANKSSLQAGSGPGARLRNDARHGCAVNF